MYIFLPPTRITILHITAPLHIIKRGCKQCNSETLSKPYRKNILSRFLLFPRHKTASSRLWTKSNYLAENLINFSRIYEGF